MEIRKIQKTGVSTMTVSLPKSWIESQGLKRGDPLEIDFLPDGSLSISRIRNEKEEPARKVIKVNPGETGTHVMRKLIASYLAGFNIIEVRAGKRLELGIKKEVKEFTRLVIGPEVIEENTTSLVLHDLSDPAELPQRKCVRRMHLLVRSMHLDAMTSFETSDEDLAKDVIDRDMDVDRLYLMVAKQYNMILKDRRLADKLGINVFDGMNLMLAARMLERIGDHAEKIARITMGRSKDERDRDLILALKGLSGRAVKLLDSAVDSIFRKDISLANSIIDMGEDLVQDCEALGPKVEGYVHGVVENTVLDSVLRTAMYAIDIAETAINMAITSD